MSDQAVDDPSLSETGGEVAIEILESDAKREESTDLPVSNGNVASEEGQDQVQADPSSSESAVVVSPVPADDSSADSNFLSEPSTVPAISLSEPSSDSISDATTALSEPIITATLSSSEPEPAEDTVSQSDDVSADAPSSSSASASASSSSSQTLIPPTPATEESEVEAWRATLIATTATLLMYSSRVSRMPLAPCSNQLVCESMRPWFGCLMLRTIPHLRLRTKPFLSPPSCRQPSMPFIPKLKERSCLAV